jgi:hypothetical protein
VTKLFSILNQKLILLKVLSFVGIGNLVSPPLGGFAYNQYGILAVALLASSVLLVDLVMRSLLIEKRVTSQYYPDTATLIQETRRLSLDDAAVELQETLAEGQVEAPEQDGDHDLPFTEEQLGLIGSEITSREYFIEPPSNRLLRSIPLLSCFRNPSLLAALFLNATQAILLGAFDATLPLEGYDLYHFDPFTSSLFFLPIMLLRLAFGPVGGWAVDRFGSKVAAVSGYTFLIPTLLLFRLIGITPRNISLLLYCLLLALCGAGMAIVGTPGFVEGATVVKKYHDRNSALFGANAPFASLYGMNLMVFSFGMTLGPMMAGILRER